MATSTTASPAGPPPPPAPTTTARAGAPAARRAPSTTTAAPPTATTAPPTTTAPPAGPTAAITIQNFAFSPPVLNVTAGTTVTATNRDSAPHSWTADDGSWDSGTLGQNASFSHRFGRSGTFSYYCAIHPSMKGTVNVA
ncbi:MAG: cupredoxin domain-containing protein [Actinobacteria bacterium]|nr:cupredoxin domain-containing protein [Actinomycetota bacterium]